MDNPVNCWKPEMVISSQAQTQDSVFEGSETIREDGVPSSEGKRGTPRTGEEIVRSVENKNLQQPCWVYKIISSCSDKVYYGITNNLDSRWRSHLFISLTSTLPLYCAMRKHGIENFKMVPLLKASRDYCCDIEKKLIAEHDNLYNLAPGGEGGFTVTDKESWLTKLRKARVGHKPALGMVHSEENKKLFSEISTKYWEDKKYPAYVTKMSFVEAKKLYGISKTHYYRLRRALSHD